MQNLNLSLFVVQYQRDVSAPAEKLKQFKCLKIHFLFQYGCWEYGSSKDMSSIQDLNNTVNSSHLFENGNTMEICGFGSAVRIQCRAFAINSIGSSPKYESDGYTVVAGWL